MTFNSVIDTATTLFLVYLYISLTCSALNEWMASLLERRPKMLRDAIRGLLGDKMQEMLYKSAAISVLKTKRYENAGFPDNLFIPLVRRGNPHQISRAYDRDPAVIPAEAFVAGLLSTLHTVVVQAVPTPLTVVSLRQAIVDQVQQKGLDLTDDKFLTEATARALLGLLEDIGITAPQAAPPPQNQPNAAALAAASASIGLAGTAVGVPAVPMLPTSGMDEAKKRLSVWYSDALDRTTGAYKRKTQVYLIFWAIAVCSLLNADTLKIAKLRYQANEAAKYAAIAAPLLGTSGAAPSPAGGQIAVSAKSDGSLSQQTIDAQLKLLRADKLPLGWTKSSFTHFDLSAVVIKLLGLMITAVAGAQGAPFWFDTLNRFVNLRLTGPISQDTSGGKK